MKKNPLDRLPMPLIPQRVLLVENAKESLVAEVRERFPKGEGLGFCTRCRRDYREAHTSDFIFEAYAHPDPDGLPKREGTVVTRCNRCGHKEWQHGSPALLRSIRRWNKEAG